MRTENPAADVIGSTCLRTTVGSPTGPRSEWRVEVTGAVCKPVLVTALLLTLIILGGCAELAGIGLGVCAIRTRARQLRTFETTLPPVRATAGSAFSFSSAGRITAGDESMEQRMDAMERLVDEQREELIGQMRFLHEDAVNTAQNRANDVETNLNANLDRLQTLLTGLARDNWMAWLALGLLVTGVILQTTSNLIQIVTTH